MVLVRRLALLALGLQVLLVVSGTAVRVTGSGLGCPTWPRCTGGSLTNTAALGSHGYIEFGNRLLAVVMEAVGIALVLAVRRHVPQHTRLALVQAAVVPLQAIIGGLLVLSGLNPYVLILHFLTSFPLVYGAAALVQRLHDPRNANGSVEGSRNRSGSVDHRVQALLSGALVASTALALVLGTLVTGTGPHAGDPKVDRLPFSPRDVTQLHADAVYLLVGLVVAALILMPTRWTAILAGLVLAQAAIGYWQYFTGVPPLLVGLHVLGATLLFTTASWIQLSTRRATPVPPERSATPILA
ncbi:MAG: cytochrome oxidase assembly protein [Frankiales bacterium]|nr:cytochrome oxidase assembly protein [Frankiales bacterium]